MFKTHTGSVWFTVEWRVDNVPEKALKLEGKALKNVIAHSNRYSASKSARTIAIVSAAGLSLIALAGPAALAAAAAAGSVSICDHLIAHSIALLMLVGQSDNCDFSACEQCSTRRSKLGGSHSIQLICWFVVINKDCSAQSQSHPISIPATTLTASALEAITEDTGISPDRSTKVQTSLNALTTAVAAGSVGGAAAARGTKKAVMTAGTTLISKIAARSAKKDNAAASKISNEHLLPAGKTERVYGVFIGFRTRNFAIREVHDEKGEGHMELWDSDAGKRLI